MKYSLNKVSQITKISVRNLQYMIERGYLRGFRKKIYPNKVVGYEFGARKLKDLAKLKTLMDTGFSLKGAWDIVDNNISIDKVLKEDM